MTFSLLALAHFLKTAKLLRVYRVQRLIMQITNKNSQDLVLMEIVSLAVFLLTYTCEFSCGLEYASVK